MTRKMPVQKPGKSKQDYQTDPRLIEAVVRRFGPIEFDLAASAHNTQHAAYYSKRDNSLVREWHKLGGLLWLNPEFADIDPWAKKCADEGAKGARVLMLTPAAIGSNWFADHVMPNALVLALRPRLTFVGETQPYVKDCILSCFGFGVTGFNTWRWLENGKHRGVGASP